MKRIVLWSALAAAALLAALGAWQLLRPSEEAALRSLWEEARGQEAAGTVALLYPLEGAVFPGRFPPPLLRWKGSEGARSWLVALAPQGAEAPLLGRVTEPAWRPPPPGWEAASQAGLSGPVEVTVLALGPDDRVLGRGRTAFTVSDDPVGGRILFRDLPLPFLHAAKHPEEVRWRLADPASAGPAPVVLEGVPACTGCHAASGRGGRLALQADFRPSGGSLSLTGASGTVRIDQDSLYEWSGADPPGSGLLPALSPGGRYLAGTVADRYLLSPREDPAHSLFFLPLRGLLSVYDTRKKLSFLLPGADDPAFVHCAPAWSPDGASLYFCRAPAGGAETDAGPQPRLTPRREARIYEAGEKTVRFEICRVPFREGRGGEPEPVAGASGGEGSHYFPRLSPDGRWLVFCRARHGMMLQPDAELWIAPAGGGEARRLRCNTGSMCSWHDWSPSGRWLVFASKTDGPYTRLHLAHVDEEGRSAPAVLLEGVTPGQRAASLPVFLAAEGTPLARLEPAFVTHRHYHRHGAFLSRELSAFTEALPFFREALSRDPGSIETRNDLGVALFSLGENEAAEAEFDRVLEKDPGNLVALVNLAIIYQTSRRMDLAEENYETVLAVEPRHRTALQNLATICSHQGRLDRADALLRRLLAAYPDSPRAHLALGLVEEKRGREEPALAHFRRALVYVPERLQDGLDAAQVLLQKDELLDEVDAFLAAALRDTVHDGPILSVLGQLRIRQGRLEEALQAFLLVRQTDPRAPSWVDERITELEQRIAEAGGK